MVTAKSKRRESKSSKTSGGHSNTVRQVALTATRGAAPMSSGKVKASTGTDKTSSDKVNATDQTGPSEGDRMPLAELLDQDGKSVNLSEFIGKPFVVYFYPKDDTPGCTREACGFQENLSGLKRAKARVVGISADSVQRHRKFADKYGITFPLLVDEDRKYMEKCGVIGEKVLYGKRSLGIIRTTFIVDKAGKIHRVFRKVKVDGHIDEVLEALAEVS
jgi:peroxiredoxin Q/BCP